MRILHTSDWHIGQSLHQFDRTHEHRRFLAWLVDVLADEQVDALLVAGDIFDNANPSAAAQAMLFEFLAEARQRVPHLSIVLTAGNHDSPGRLEAPGPLLNLVGAAAVGQYSVDGEDAGAARLAVPLKDRHGTVRAWCIAMPFLRPGDVLRAGREGADPYLSGITQAYGRAYRDVAERREADQAIVAMGHCHLTDGQVSEDSERRIVVGGAEALDAGCFDPGIAYVALGHLHLAQAVGGDRTRRYSGSPLPMSFSEIAYPHQVVIVDLEGEGVSEIRELRVPRFVDLLRVPAAPAPAAEVIDALRRLAVPDRPEAEWPYLQVRVLLDQPEPGLRALVEEALADKAVRLARIEISYRRSESEDAGSPAASLDDMQTLAPENFFQRLYQQRFGSAVPEPLSAAFAELLLDSDGEGA